MADRQERHSPSGSAQTTNECPAQAPRRLALPSLASLRLGYRNIAGFCFFQSFHVATPSRSLSIRLPKRRGHPLRSASKPCVRLVASHGSSSMRSVVTDTFRFVFGMPLVVAVAMKSTFVAEFFLATFTFWGEMIDFYLIFLPKEQFTPSAFALLFL